MKLSTKTNTNTLTTRITLTAMLAAVAFVLQYIEVSIPLVPSFLKIDFSDIPELIGTFILGPLYGVLICLVKNVLHMPFSSSNFVGELSNFILGASFVLVAGLIYKHKKSVKTALVGCIAGAGAMALVSVISNYFIVYPAYAQLWAGGDMGVIINMYKIILPYSDTLLKSLIIFNVPFTLAKGIIVAIITMIIYKPLSKLIVKMNLALSKRKQKQTS